MLKETRRWDEYSVQDMLEDNLVNFWQEGLIRAGAYKEVTFAGAYSGFTNLQNVSGNTYEFFGPKLVWQVDDVIQPSGLFVDGVWTTTGYEINWENGTVTLDSAASTVQAEYTFPDVDVIGVSHKNWKVIREEHQSRFQTIEQVAPSGIASVLKENRVWMPTMVIDFGETSSDPLQLGGGDIVKGMAEYHVYGDNKFKVKRIYDYLLTQQYTTIKMYDTEIVKFGKDGTSYSNAGSGFWSKITFMKGAGNCFLSPFGLDRAEFRQNFELDRPPSRF